MRYHTNKNNAQPLGLIHAKLFTLFQNGRHRKLRNVLTET